MAVPKTTERKCRDRAYKHCTNNTIPTFFHAQCHFPVISDYNERKMSRTKERCTDGVICAVFFALSLRLVSVVFGTAILLVLVGPWLYQPYCSL